MGTTTVMRDILRPLPREATLALLTLPHISQTLGLRDGAQQQRLAAELLRSNASTMGELPGWIEQRSRKAAIDLTERALPSGKALSSLVETAWRKAERSFLEGLRVARVASCPALSRSNASNPCPAVLFYRDNLDQSRPHIAVFNSRKSRRFTAREPWLEALRAVLQQFDGNDLGWLGSIGTLTYDLWTAHARSRRLPLTLILPSPVRLGRLPRASGPAPTFGPHTGQLSCMAPGAKCPRRTGMVCRDRLLAELSDHHIVVSLRKGGNLIRVLGDSQRRLARPITVVDPPKTRKTGDANFSGNRQLQEEFPNRCTIFQTPRSDGSNSPQLSRTTCSLTVTPVIVSSWDLYLYHYTRAVPGPWPDQIMDDYLLDLLDAKPGCEHSGLDTLIRILEGKRLRGSTKLIKGDVRVVSWSALPPHHIGKIRQWRPGLIRWTFEPYGLAVKRTVLRRMGAKPAVYVPASRYDRLPEAERYRYQRHEPPGCTWKHEREWRLKGDLLLDRIPPDEILVFVPTAEAAENIASRIRIPYPVVRTGAV